MVIAADLDETVREWARKVSDKSPLLMRLGKDAIHATRDMSLPHALPSLRSELALALTPEDIGEGVASFGEKRAPECTPQPAGAVVPDVLTQ